MEVPSFDRLHKKRSADTSYALVTNTNFLRCMAILIVQGFNINVPVYTDNYIIFYTIFGDKGAHNYGDALTGQTQMKDPLDTFIHINLK